MLDPTVDVMRDRARMASRTHWQLAVVGLGTAAVQLDTAVNIAFPAITDAFALATPDIQWVVIAYVLTYSILLLGFGRLGDRLGHARVFRLGVACTIAAHILCSLASGFGWLLAARVAQGVGAALVLSCGPALATGLFAEERRTRILGAYALMMGLAGTIGPWIGGALVQLFGWQAVFWFRVPIAIVALIAMVLPVIGGRWPMRSAETSAPVGWQALAALAQPGFALLNIASVLV
ncbi:MAG: MFS transporter, partial [Alphaproteobacteria bacterium]|nr:MFS transporter [Alphaproteobacteria bacterium]